MTLGPIDEEGIREMQERYEALEPSDKKIVEEEEDKLLSTMIYNYTAYMIMMEVNKLKHISTANIINKKTLFHDIKINFFPFKGTKDGNHEKSEKINGQMPRYHDLV